MSYEEAIAYLYERVPMFQKDGKIAYKVGLHNIIAFCEELGQPQHQFKSIHVAGTNGKGSTSHTLAAILQSAGYKVGLFTSPHLKDFRERVRINGEMISKQNVAYFLQTYQPLIERLNPSFFEVTVAMAYHYFAQQAVDIAIIEVGLGGRLDSTNIITPQLCVITSIGYDHMDILGNTLPQIATEKAGIIKDGVPVVISEEQPEIAVVFEEKAASCNAPLRVGTNEIMILQHALENGKRKVKWQYKQHTQEAYFSLLGDYQITNLKGILTAAYWLQEMGYTITENAIQNGLSSVQPLTGLQGRWQLLQQNPLVIADVAHNESGIRYAMQQLQKSYTYEKLYLVIGMVKDKDVEKIGSLLPKNAHYIICEPSLPRALPAVELAKIIQERCTPSDLQIIKSPPKALKYALQQAQKEDCIYVGGSTFVVAEIV
jgi:dihydrofolate synthase/folylpolyglutamate synthase